MESFLYSIKRSESPLCLCGDEAQTAVHAILHCKLVPEELRDGIMEILGGKGSFYEDIVTFVDASRDIVLDDVSTFSRLAIDSLELR